ncbi:MAG: Type 1 glutamine amidotransferase-like domain-containing protein [Smithellaceae bacterium]|jgi:peptidase E
MMRPAPIILISGGPNSNNTTLIAEALALSKTQKPIIAYIGAASSDDKEFFSMLRRMLISAGADKVTLVPIVQGFERKKTESILSSGDLVFISGGDVKAGMEYLEKRNLVPFLRKLYESGKPFFGISAGAIMLCRNWIHWRKPADDSSAKSFPCLGFAPVLCDTHAEDEGWNELRTLLGLCPEGTIGYGIPAGGALRVTENGEVTDIGSPAVRFIKKGADIIIV